MDTTVDPLVGRLLDRRYAIESRLAAGGMATVYEALDTRLDRLVALKVMHPQLAANPEFVARFIREAKAAARLSHPNVVAVFDQGTDAGVVFLAMEHIAGRTLRDLLRERGRLSPAEALHVLEPVLAALGAAHAAGIVHRDVKPENVLLADDGRVKVTDFGLARAVTAPTGTTQGLLLGTVAYLSPEQVERGIADPRSDVYAAGIMLYELVTGEKPYDGDGPLQVAYRHVHEVVPPPSARAPGIPPAFDALVGAATSRDPDLRPVDASALLAEIVRNRSALATPLAYAPNGASPRRVAAHDSEPTLVVPVERAAAGSDVRTVAKGAGGPAVDARPPRPVLDDGIGRRGRFRAGRIVIVAVILAALALSGGAWYMGSGPGAYTDTPKLVLLTEAEARKALRAAGLDARIGQPQPSDDVASGSVLKTVPAAGERVKKSGDVTLILSSGPERVAVPDVAKGRLTAARATLEAARLEPGRVIEEFSATVPRGRVVRTMPATGALVVHDSTVTLVVSKGVERVRVPQVVAQEPDPAEKALRDKGFQVKRAETFSDTVPAGRVARVSPSGTAPKGSTLTLWISKGPQLVTVPDVVRKPLDEARRILTEAGLQVGNVFNLPVGPDEVVDQDPDAGKQVPKGSKVNLSVF